MGEKLVRHRLSKRVEGVYGFADLKIQVVVDPPLLPKIALDIEDHEIQLAINFLLEAKAHNERMKRMKGGLGTP